MTLSRQQLVEAFPDQPRLVAEFEALGDLIETAQSTLAQLNEAIAAAQQQIEDDTRWQAVSSILSGIAALNGEAGVPELVGTDQVAVRQIDGLDPASLLSRSAAYAVLIGRAGKGATAQRPALTAQQQGIYFDTTLAAAGKPIFWTGTAWVDATGAVV